jgi:LmbE family N-acetylglucosaminyl deacetylase
MAVGSPTHTVLGIFPHPDDEAYAAAGTLALAARAGARVEILCATRGERGGRHRPALDAPALAELRSRELAESCRRIGARPPRFLDLPDGEVQAHVDDAARARTMEVLAELAPDTVVTLGHDGVYGHRDHIATTGLVEACVAMLPIERRPCVLLAEFPRNHFEPVYRSLRKRRGQRFVASLDHGTGIRRDQADVVVDIGAVAATKLAAMGAHASQLPGSEPRDLLAPGVMASLLAEEWFRRATGSPPCRLPGID